MVELKLAAEMAVITDEIGGFFRLHIEDFSDGQCFMGLEGSVFHLFQEDADAFGFVQHVSNGRESVGMIHRIIPEGKGFLDVDDGINPETGDALVQPPVDHFIELLAKLRILPVEIRLTFVEHMEIIELIVTRNRFPYGAAEIGAPVGRKLSVVAFLEVEIFSIFSLGIPESFLEPLMLVGTVVDNQVHEDIHVPFFCLS